MLKYSHRTVCLLFCPPGKEHLQVVLNLPLSPVALSRETVVGPLQCNYNLIKEKSHNSSL